MKNTFASSREIFAGADPSICHTCPPEQVCAWHCVQGSSALEIIVETTLAQEKLVPWPRYELDPRPGFTRSALMESYG